MCAVPEAIMGLDVYYTLLSQPSRTVAMFLQKNDVEYNFKDIDMLKGEHQTPEYLAINPLHTVPAVSDDGFNICQSAAIVRYVFGKYKLPDFWYPADPQKRAKVDEILDWYSSTIRKHGSLCFYIAVGPYVGMPTVSEEEQDKRFKELDDAFTTFEDIYLKDQTFLCGDEITIADLFCANEVFQPTNCDRDVLKTHPRITAWMERVRQRMNPVWDKIIDEFGVLLKSAQTGPK